MVRRRLGGQQLIAPDLPAANRLRTFAFSPFGSPDAIGPAGTRIAGRCPNDSAPITSPGTILSHTPRSRAPSNMSWDSATAVAIATTSRLNSDNSMPARPCVMPSHIAGTPPANCAVPPAARIAALSRSG